MKKKYKRLSWIVLLVLFTNWAGFKNITGLNRWYYLYSNISGTCTVIENSMQARVFRKPADGKIILNRPGSYGCNLMPQSDTIVYRLFSINPLKFWRWGEYVFDWRYRLPYADWTAIQQKRGFGRLKVSYGCMEF